MLGSFGGMIVKIYKEYVYRNNSNWDVLGPIDGIAVDKVHTEIHW